MIHKIFFSLLFGAMLLNPLFGINFNSHKKTALLIGISKYQNGTTLPGIEKDLKRMKNMLEKKGYSVTVLKNEDATYQNVVDNLKDFANSLDEDDTFVFYVSTHGTQVPDLNGDEEDGKDEAYVLYDATMNSEKGLLIDDETDRLMANIKAKKFVLNDTCHSGTIYKDISNYNIAYKFKQISPNFKYSKNYSVYKDLETKKPKEMVAMSASEDKGLSIATKEGSLFTSAFIDIWKSDDSITFENMKEKATRYIENMASQDNILQVSKPTLYATKDSLKSEKIDNYLNINIHISSSNTNLYNDFFDELIARYDIEKLKIKSIKDEYNINEHIVLNIDKNRKTDEHLYIFKDSGNKIEMLFPNKYQIDSTKWSSSFPDTNAPFVLTAKINGTNNREHTKIYAIATSNKIDEFEYGAKLFYKHSFKEIIKSFSNYTTIKNATKAILIKKTSKFAIGRCEFDVVK